MPEYTPTTEQVRDGYTARRGFMVPRDERGETMGWWLKRQGDVSVRALKAFSGEAFDRWLAAHDAEVWDQGYERAESDHYGTGFWTKSKRSNPYRSGTEGKDDA